MNQSDKINWLNPNESLENIIFFCIQLYINKFIKTPYKQEKSNIFKSLFFQLKMTGFTELNSHFSHLG